MLMFKAIIITAGTKIPATLSAILIVAITTDEREKRIDPSTCIFKMNNNELTKTETGFYIPENVSESQILSVIIVDDALQQYLTFINLVIE